MLSHSWTVMYVSKCYQLLLLAFPCSIFNLSLPSTCFTVSFIISQWLVTSLNTTLQCIELVSLNINIHTKQKKELYYDKLNSINYIFYITECKTIMIMVGGISAIKGAYYTECSKSLILRTHCDRNYLHALNFYLTHKKNSFLMGGADTSTPY